MSKRSTRHLKPDTQTEVMSDQIEIEVANLRLLSTPQIRDKLEASLRLTAQNLITIAGCIRVLEERGERAPEICDGLMSHLRMISQGRLSAAAVVAFSSKPAVLKAIRGLPIEEQERITKEGTIEIAKKVGNKIVTQKVKVTSMGRTEIAQAIDGARIRTPGEQSQILKKKTDPTNTDDVAFLTITVTVAEKAKFHKKAAEAGVSDSEFGRNGWRELDMI
jgi:hypothetical protein